MRALRDADDRSASASRVPACAGTSPSSPGSSVAVVTGVLHFAHVEPVVVVIAGVALGGLAWAISIATESVGERFGWRSPAR